MKTIFSSARLLAALGLLALPLCSAAQITNVVEGISPSSGTTTYSSAGILLSPSTSTQPVNISNTAQITYLAAQQVHLQPGFRAHPATTGNFHAQINPSSYDVIMDPASGSVPKYSKVEFSIKVPQQITDDIANFLVSSHPALNPFNPGDISVEATFIPPTGPSKLIYGYYSRDYKYSQTTISPQTTWDDITGDYVFKVRFAPDQTGPWICRIAMKYPGLVGADFNFNDIYFNVTNSSDPGYVETGNNGYLKFQNGDSYFITGAYLGWANYRYDGAYNPIHEPHGIAVRPYEYDDFMTILNDVKDAGGNYARIILAGSSWAPEGPVGTLDANGNWIIKNNVGNYYDRLPHVWELDRVINWAEQNNVYIGMNVFLPDAIIDDNGASTDLSEFEWWDSNPYRLMVGADGTKFFSDATCKSYFKNYLRYLVARYGYSTHIAKFEINSEGNLSGQQVSGDGCFYYNPYAKVLSVNNSVSGCSLNPATYFSNYQFQPDPQSANTQNNTTTYNVIPNTALTSYASFGQLLSDWDSDMLGYVKNTLHLRQLLNTSRASFGTGLVSLDPYDQVFNMSENQTMTLHHYSIDPNENVERAAYTQFYKGNYSKPFFFEEMGSSDFAARTIYDDMNQNPPIHIHTPSGPDYHQEEDPTIGGGDIEMHNSIWATAMSGTCGTTPYIVPGPKNANRIQMVDHTDRFFANNMPALAAFFNGIDFESRTYLPIHYPNFQPLWNPSAISWASTNTLTTDPVEKFILYSSDQAMGWVHLRRWYWASANLTEDPNEPLDPYCNCQINHCNINTPNGWLPYSPDDLNHGAAPPFTSTSFDVQVANGTYTIDWYDTRTPNTIVYSDPNITPSYTVGPYYFVTIQTPFLRPAYQNCSTCWPDLAFKLYKTSNGGFHRLAQDSTAAPALHGFQISPNPGTGLFVLQADAPVNNATIEILDLTGRSVYKKVYATLSKEELDLSALADGVYYARVSDGEKVYATEKIIKQQ